MKYTWRNTLGEIPVFCATAFSTGISPEEIAVYAVLSDGGGGDDGDRSDGDGDGDGGDDGDSDGNGGGDGNGDGDYNA